ncbi:MAG: hypothetical protein LBC86_00150 [Oscillospiraceae bacterium]|nr:hypothetical protein [Oscillospiraceae bacterium]
MARNTLAVGEKRFITAIHERSGVVFAFQLGVRSGDTSNANTTGFANVGGIVGV